MFCHCSHAVPSFRIIISHHAIAPPPVPPIGGRSSPSFPSSTLIFLILLPSFATLIDGGFSYTNYPGGAWHSPTPAPDANRAGVTVRLTFNDPEATDQSIRLATTLFAKRYSEGITPVAGSYEKFDGGVGLWEQVAGWYAEAVEVECPKPDRNRNVLDYSVTLPDMHVMEYYVVT